MLDQKEIIKHELNVKAELEHIKKRFARKLGEGRQIHMCSDEFWAQDRYCFYSGDASEKDDVLTKGVILPDRSNSKLILFKDHYELRTTANPAKLITYIIDLDGLSYCTPDNSIQETYVFENISPKNILGWFIYDADKHYDQDIEIVLNS